ncbi:MAG: M20/M25/M40 family metallo-hydrolase [Phycisphaerales bacterium]|jgi:N-acetylated-alpha-linked acidic dipeptidase|nr:M20/M25/M40 family metallo-hydrolase [Phycisphaerales bacterium]
MLNTRLNTRAPRSLLLALALCAPASLGAPPDPVSPAREREEEAQAARPVIPEFPAPAGWSGAAVELARRAIAIPDPARLRAWHDMTASFPHDAGTEGDARVIESLAGAFREMGLDVEVHEFWALLAVPVSASLEIVAPDRVELSLREDALPEDAYSGNPALRLGFNAFSASGDVTAPVVYANYATKADFEKLKDLGVDVTGRIVLARYGGNYRGFKAKFAEDAGAVGLIIYTDPADSGYAQGLMWPRGGYASPSYIQRGSIANTRIPGDQLTPFVEATKDAKRLDPHDAGLPGIPVQPVGWDAAQKIMERMEGDEVPAGWQGGLPLRYRITGGDALRVRLKVEQKHEVIKTANVIATLKGASRPDERVVIGCHHDAWGYGAGDPAAGMVCVLEAARAMSELARQGERPVRTVQFAAWGAEEQGIIGSTEYVEREAKDLTRNAVAYFNLDMAAMGPQFGSGASPVLKQLVRDAATIVPQARDPERSVFDEWNARAGAGVGDLGGGSDHVGFWCFAGVPSLTLGGGGSRGVSYHSIYDNLNWYRAIVGEDYEPALMVSRMILATLAPLAMDDDPPYDLVAHAEQTRAHLRTLARIAIERGVVQAPEDGREWPREFEGIVRSIDWYAAVADRFERALHDPSESGRIAPDAAARAMLDLNAVWLDERGLPERAWFRNQFAATDEDSGYAAWMLPGLRASIERKDAELLATYAARLGSVFDRMASRLARELPREE